MSTPEDHTFFPAERLRSFVTEVFLSLKIPEADAIGAADVLLYADSHGIDSHGVGRLMTYVEFLRAEKINPRPNIEVVQRRKSAATVDGDNGLGLVVGPRANRLAAEMAGEFGTGWVSVRHTHHFGAAGFYAAQTVREHDMIGWAMTNSSKLVAPLWGAEPMFGTNPIAFGVPAHRQPPMIVDMATSAVPFGKVEIAMRAGRSLPDGWGIDGEGHPTNDPQALIDGGSLLPLGSERTTGGHKGQCLLSMVDVLCCVLSGANWGPFGPPSLLWQDPPDKQVGKGIGHFFGVMDVEAFRDKAEFKRQMDEWMLVIRGTRPQPGTDGPLIPGDPERLAHEERSKTGIPVVDAVVKDLEKISSLTGVSLNTSSP